MSAVNLNILLGKIKSVSFQNVKLATVLIFLLLTYIASNSTNTVQSNVSYNITNPTEKIFKKTNCVSCVADNFFNNKSSIQFNKRFQSECGLIFISHFLELFVCEKNFADLNFSLIQCFTFSSVYIICLRGPPAF